MEVKKSITTKFMTRKDAAARYGVSLRHFDKLMTAGVIPHVHLGKRCIRIPIEKADAAIDALMIGKEPKR